MNVMMDVIPSAKEEELVTYISADLKKLYDRAFEASQKQTASVLWEYPHETRAGQETWRGVLPIVRDPYGYDPAIIRLYEDIIAELQRELARYKEYVWELLYRREIDTDVMYARGQVTVLPTEIAQKLRARTEPGLRMLDYEI